MLVIPSHLADVQYYEPNNTNEEMAHEEETTVNLYTTKFSKEVTFNLVVLDRQFSFTEPSWLFSYFHDIPVEDHVRIVRKCLKVADPINLAYLNGYLINARLVYEIDFTDLKNVNVFYPLLFDLVENNICPDIVEFVLRAISDLLSFESECNLYSLAWLIYDSSPSKESLQSSLYLIGMFSKYIPNPVYYFF